MLAREFRTAQDLGIPQEVHDALVAFTREEKVAPFSMQSPEHCIVGYCRKRGADVPFEIIGCAFDGERPLMGHLFYSTGRTCSSYEITLRQAQEAVRNALTFGDPMWADVMAVKS